MAITYISSAEQNSTSQSSPHTMTVDIGTRTNGMLVVVVLARSTTSRTFGDATYAGTTMGSATPYQRNTTTGVWHQITIYYLVNPTNGSNTFSVAWTGGSLSFISVVPLWVDGAHQTQAEVLDKTATANDGGVAGDPSVDISPDYDNELLIGAYHSLANDVLTPSATLVQDHDYGPYVAGVAYAIQTTKTAATLSWAGADDLWDAVAVSFRAAGASNTTPTVTLDTADAGTGFSTTPTLLFTGTDGESDAIRYQVQISDSPDFIGGVNLQDNDSISPPDSSGGFHPNGNAATTWQGNYQVDDRFGHSFVAHGGILDHASSYIQTDDTGTDGTALARIYAITGTPGTDAAPANAALPANTPTPGWLAESDPIEFVYPFTEGVFDFDFTGANRIWLDADADYMVIFDWRPTTGDYHNLIEFSMTVSTLHPGNAYIDGYGEANNGPWLNNGLCFGIYEANVLLDKLSGTDAGFANEDTPADTDPFTSGEQVSYTVQAGDALEAGRTYYWRVRVTDPSGTNLWGDWTAARSFTTSAGGLVVQDATHAHVADAPALTQHNTLVVADAAHSHVADGAALTQHNTLVVADSAHAHSAEGVALTQHYVLVVADAAHAHSADSVTLELAGQLAVQDAAHAHSADNLALTQHHVLAVQDAAHAHVADNVALSGPVVQLVVQDAAHAHSAGALVLGVALFVQDATHAHAADAVALTQHHVLVVADAAHSQRADNVALGAGVVYVVAALIAMRLVASVEAAMRFTATEEVEL